MEAFDFNQFQRQIFREIFSDPLQKIPERDTSIEVKRYVPKKKVDHPKVSTESTKKGRGRPKSGATFTKKKNEDDDFLVENERKPSKKRQSPTQHTIKPTSRRQENISRKKQLAIKKICKTPVRVQATAFEIHQKSAEIESNQKNIRRSLRAKLKKRKSVEVIIEIIEKENHEITNQDEFLHFLGLRKA